MRDRITLAAAALCLCVTVGFAQTSSELKKKYGPAIEAFEVRRGVLLTTKYSSSGQVCEMVLENRHKTAVGFNLDNTLTDEVVEQLIAELVPAGARGERDKNYGWSIYLGQSLQTNYSYERVEIISAGTKSSKHLVVFIRWKDRQCE